MSGERPPTPRPPARHDDPSRRRRGVLALALAGAALAPAGAAHGSLGLAAASASSAAGADVSRSIAGLPVLRRSGPGGALGQGAVVVGSLDPVRQDVAAPRPFALDGAGLDAVALAALYDAQTAALVAVLSPASSSPAHLDLDVPVGLPPGDCWLTLWNGSGGLEWASMVFLDPPLPVVEFAVPPIASAVAPTALSIHGQHLAGATRALLERDGARLVGLGGLAVVGESELQVTVPAGVDPGAWRVRVVTRGGISLEPVEVLVTPAPRPLPRVRTVTPREVSGDVERYVYLAGRQLSGALTVRAVGPADLLLDFEVQRDGGLEVRVPPGTPPGLYDLAVRTSAGESPTSEAKLLVVDPATAEDLLGDGSAVAVDGATVRLQGHGAWSVIERGRLRVVVDDATGLARLSDSGDAAASLGIAWEAPDPAAHAGAPGTTYLGLAANPAAGGVDFRYAHGGAELFAVTWGLAGGALELAFTFDSSGPAHPGNALAIGLGSIDLPRGTDQLVAAWGGIRLRAIDLLQPQAIAFPDHHDHPLVFAEDPAGGGLLIDLGPLGEQGSLRTVHRSASGGATRVEVEVTPALALRSGATLGPARFVLEDGGWADAVEPLQQSVGNPLRPAWLDEVTGVFRIIGLNSFSDVDLVPALVEDVYAAIEPGVPDPGGWQLLHAVEPSEEGLAGVPDWTLSTSFAQFAAALRPQGWRVVPYLATPGLQDEHPLFPVCAGARLARWNVATQQLDWRFWDADGDGACCADPMDYWLVNVAHAPYRDFVHGAVVDQHALAPFDGVYLDYMKANARRDDRNPANGDAVLGYGQLAQALEASLGAPGAEFLVAGEGSSVQLTQAGNGLAAIHVLEPGLLERDPLGGGIPLHRAHPIGTHLTLDQTPATTTSELAMPGWHPGQFHMVRLAEVAHGALPTAAAIGFGGWVWPSFAPSERRALVQVAEEGLHWRLHGVRPFTDPHPLWDDPETVRLFEVDGAVVARTRRWVVEKTVCDAYWRFGARGPTPSELDELAGRTDASFTGLFAATCEVRQRFRENPTPHAEVRTRSAARAEILLAMPDYPAP